MDIATFYSILAQPLARGYGLNGEQKNAVEHGDGPLWILAGPGSGKTEVLVTRALRLLAVGDAAGNRVPPRSILITTFTKKAARNLEDRLATYLAALQEADDSLRDIDLADMRIGTIHSLCDDILHEFRYPAYQNVRLLDDVDQHLFIYQRAEIANNAAPGFWAQFEYAVPNWNPRFTYPPNRWQRVKASVVLFNRIVEDLIDVDVMRAAGGNWSTLADYYIQYVQALQSYYRCDFAHLQARFLEFLNAPASARFLDGDQQDIPPLQHVLVDEYQDTNPIQEHIYLALAGRALHNLTVVGDDDQALYRFRGGTVTCMVNFNRACEVVFQETPTPIQLRENFRSHAQIVGFFNTYISSFPEMQAPGVRAPGKQDMVAMSDITGDYPAVGWITRRQAGELAAAVADLVQNILMRDGIISDWSQCVLLFRSTKDSDLNAGPFLEEFRRRNIPVYNPRSKSFMESEEVQCLLAALIHVVDAPFTFAGNQRRDLPTLVQGWINTLLAVPGISNGPLRDYITKSNEELPNLCAAHPGWFIGLTLHEILYRILSLEPFRTWRQEPVRNMRLSKVTRLFESYHSLNQDELRANADGDDLDQTFRDRFYNMFIGFLLDTGIDDDEDDEVIVPPGALPLMTIHQSKGLEFPFVVVLQVGQHGRIGAAQRLEHEMAPFRQELYPRTARTEQELVTEDDIRLFYVAYSRAEYGLVLVGTRDQIRNNVAAPNRDFTEFRRTVPVLEV